MAQLNISQREAKNGSSSSSSGGEITILDLDGDILFGDGTLALRAALRRALGDGRKRILLNFSGVGYVDSSGIGELVSGLTAAGRDNARLKFVNPAPRLRELLTITKLLTIFEVYETENEALASYD